MTSPKPTLGAIGLRFSCFVPTDDRAKHEAQSDYGDPVMQFGDSIDGTIGQCFAKMKIPLPSRLWCKVCVFFYRR
jgi:hypothetical protein